MELQIKWSSYKDLDKENFLNECIPKYDGVYMIWAKSRCYYVGLTTGVKNRIIDHLSDHEKNECIKDIANNPITVFYARVPKQSDREGIEKFLFDHYKPICNINDPGGKPIMVNLPI